MDERLEKALEISNFLETRNNQKEILLSQFKEGCEFYYSGHKFVVDTILIAHCNSLKNLAQENYIVLDSNNTPVLIENLNNFLDSISQHYNTQLRRYYVEYSKLSSRSVEGLLDL